MPSLHTQTEEGTHIGDREREIERETWGGGGIRRVQSAHVERNFVERAM